MPSLGPWTRRGTADLDPNDVKDDTGPPDIVRLPRSRRHSRHEELLAGAEARLHTLKTAFELFCDDDSARLTSEELLKSLESLQSTELGSELLGVEAISQLQEAREIDDDGLDLFGFLGLLRRGQKDKGGERPALPIDAQEAVSIWALVEQKRARWEERGGELDANQVRDVLRCLGARLSQVLRVAPPNPKRFSTGAFLSMVFTFAMDVLLVDKFHCRLQLIKYCECRA